MRKLYIAGYSPNTDHTIPKSVIGYSVFTIHKNSFHCLGKVQGINRTGTKFRVIGNGKKGFFNIDCLGDGQKIYNDNK